MNIYIIIQYCNKILILKISFAQIDKSYVLSNVVCLFQFFHVVYSYKTHAIFLVYVLYNIKLKRRVCVAEICHYSFNPKWQCTTSDIKCIIEIPCLQHVAAQSGNLSVLCNFGNQKTLKNVS